MAFVVRRPGNRWEIRQSYVSEAGPRARTLATFRTLSDDVIERALRAAHGHIDRDSIVRSAKRAGAPVAGSEADALAEALIRSLARRRSLRPGLRHVLLEFLEHPLTADDSFAEWIGAPLEKR